MDETVMGKTRVSGTPRKPVIVCSSPSENWKYFLASQNVKDQCDGVFESRTFYSRNYDKNNGDTKKLSKRHSQSVSVIKRLKVDMALKPSDKMIDSVEVEKQGSHAINSSQSKRIVLFKDSAKQYGSLNNRQSTSRKVKMGNFKTQVVEKGESSGAARSKSLPVTRTIGNSGNEQGRLTRVLAIDCEMVGVQDPKKSMLARVSIINSDGECIYDRFVLPTEPVHDYRTWVSGIRPRDLQTGEQFEVVRQEVMGLIKDRILVGHALGNDFKALKLKHPNSLVRDTSKYGPFRAMNGGRTPSLKLLARYILGVTIQSGEHSSIQDAKATLQLYILYQKEWEEEIKAKYHFKRP